MAAGDDGSSTGGAAPGDAGPPTAPLGDRLFAYALPVVGTVPGTPAGQLAALAVRDALTVAAARPAPAGATAAGGGVDPDAAEPADIPADPDARLVALTRNECLRQLRARSVFVDTRADTWLPLGAAADDPLQLVAAALLGLAPGDRDALAIGWTTGLSAPDAARAVGAGSVLALGRRQSGARDALASAAGALALVADPGTCPTLTDVLLSAETPDGAITPGLRDAVTAHARGCPGCGERRRTFLADTLPRFSLPRARTLPAAVAGPATPVDVVTRAGHLDVDGFPTPLDADDVAGTRWLRWAVLAGAVSAALLLVGALVHLASQRR